MSQPRIAPQSAAAADPHAPSPESAPAQPVPVPLPMPAAPRQFALVLDEDDPEYRDCVRACGITDPVVWWGAELDDDTVLYRPRSDGGMDVAHHATPHDALARWERLYPLRLVRL